eukprot:15241043-Alexandrium_andersonii.AAC.1
MSASLVGSEMCIRDRSVLSGGGEPDFCASQMGGLRLSLPFCQPRRANWAPCPPPGPTLTGHCPATWSWACRRSCSESRARCFTCSTLARSSAPSQESVRVCVCASRALTRVRACPR